MFGQSCGYGEPRGVFHKDLSALRVMLKSQVARGF